MDLSQITYLVGSPESPLKQDHFTSLGFQDSLFCRDLSSGGFNLSILPFSSGVSGASDVIILSSSALCHEALELDILIDSFPPHVCTMVILDHSVFTLVGRVIAKFARKFDFFLTPNPSIQRWWTKRVDSPIFMFHPEFRHPDPSPPSAIPYGLAVPFSTSRHSFVRLKKFVRECDGANLEFFQLGSKSFWTTGLLHEKRMSAVFGGRPTIQPLTIDDLASTIRGAKRFCVDTNEPIYELISILELSSMKKFPTLADVVERTASAF